VETKLSYVILKPVSLFSTSRGDSTWKYSLTKFHAFNLSEYDRVLYFDSDTLVINSFDRYFDAPPAPLAPPRAYWLCSFEDQDRQWLGSHVMLIQPSPQIFSRILSQIDTALDFDMEMVNHMFGSSAMILPHRHLALLSGEFRSEDHSKYLAGSDTTKWDPHAEYANTALIHFSDWPLPKPWKVRSDKQWEEVMPKCGNQEAKVSEKQDGANTTCPDREIWVDLYAQYDSENRAVRRLIL
jgi:alpha-N-acetylglucosamine transferase